MSAGPLTGVRVLDFSTLLPGPFATLMLAEAGADVIKVEKSDGDPMRRAPADFAMLNSGKRSIQADLKDDGDRAHILELARTADVVVEQFRPGVMDRLGLGAEALRRLNPRLIYCSINGYGSSGDHALRAGHDLTYAAESGMMMLSTAADGAPVMPPLLLGDIGGGTYPALINILLALLERERTGQGSVIEVAMADNIQPFLYQAHASAFGRGHWPKPNDAIETGASPRYALYRTADDRWIAAAPVEDKFWRAFCGAIDRPELADADDRDRDRVATAIAARIAELPSREWMKRFSATDTACALVLTFEEAMAGREAQATPTLPTPIARAFRQSAVVAPPAQARLSAVDWDGPPTGSKP